MFSNSKDFRNVPHQTFSSAVSAQKDHDRKQHHYDRGIIYQPNGTGRDTYVYNDDGGFNKMKEPRSQFKPGNINLPGLDHKKFFARDKFPHIHSKPVQYPQDGSGRDSYIKIDMGGLGMSPTKHREFKQAFKSSLRSYNKIPFYLERRNYGPGGVTSKQFKTQVGTGHSRAAKSINPPSQTMNNFNGSIDEDFNPLASPQQYH